ncbi:MAG TPA: OmpA family protein [Alphaproteobacteria bacterium]|nr:OmpA family protein [Alphaproteobacteria bacterium]
MLARLVPALLSTASVLVLVAAQPAVAQAPAQATAAEGGSNLEEIVVTARRKEERVQTVPVAITAFSQADLERQHITEVRDLSRNVPSLSISTQSSDANALYSGQFRLRGLPGTVIYFNEVPLGDTDYNPTTGLTHGLGQGYYYDLDHVEVDKGPQGTLFGRNSIGGLISIMPKQPTNDFEGYGKITFGNYNLHEFEGAINVPVVQDKLLVRVAGQVQQRDGYTIDQSNGKDLDNVDYYSWRIGVTFRPTDDFENYLVYDGYYQHTNGGGEILKYINPGFTFAQIPLPILGNVPLTLGNGPGLAALENPATSVPTFLSLLGTKAAGGQPSLSFYPTLASIFAQQQALGPRAIVGHSVAELGKDYFYGFTDVARWDATDDLTIKNIAAARVVKQLATDEFTGTGLPILNIGDPTNNTSWGENSVQYTEELQILGKALDEKLSWVVGGFLLYDHPLGDTLLPSAAVGNVSYYHFHDSTRSEAVFAHGIYDLSDLVEGLKFNAGYRYTWDYVSVQEHGTNGADAITRNAAGIAQNCAPPQGFDNNCAVGSDTHFSSYGWNLGLEEQLTPDTMLYVRSGNAYRPGGTNPQVLPQFQNLKPEHVTDVEIGAKSDWEFMGIHGRTNGDLFHTDYKAIQVAQLVQVVDSQGNAHAASETQNAASATLEGGELEATFVPVEGLEIAPHASYIFSQYDKYPTAFGQVNSKAPPFYYVPKWQYAVRGTYHLPLDPALGDIAISATYSWYGHQYATSLVGEPLTILPSYENIDINIDWTNIMGSNFDAGFFMTNAQDNLHLVGVTPIYTQLGFTSVTYNAPRMFGFSLTYKFGPGTEHEEAAAGEPASSAPPAPAPVQQAAKSYQVFFDFNKSALTPEGRTIVDQAATNAGPAHVTRITVTGHTDTVGSDAYNMRLSRRRAESVAAELEAKGISSEEITLVAKGKRDPLVPTADGVREPQNRRVEIVYGGGPTS